MGFSTDAIHAGQKPDEVTGAVVTPIYMTSTYAQEEVGQNKGYVYGRANNFTRSALENNIAALEKAEHGVAFGSGVAAIHSIMGLLKKGDHVIVTDNVYGGTYRLFETVMSHYGLEYSWVDTVKFSNVEKAIKENTKMIYVETPTNPLLTLTDLRKVSDFAIENNLISVCDNTFMSPYFQNPLSYDMDIVLHSTTKYLNGHSDVIGGIVLTNAKEIHEKLRYLQRAAGAIPSPFDAWLTLRSTKTLAVRMERHNQNARKVAEFLENHSKVKKVIYPGLKSHPQHELASKQMSGFGGMVSMELEDFETANNMLKNLKVFTLAESLGGVESLACLPAMMTHASVPEERRKELGITDGLVRLSVGIEDIEDLTADLDQALGAKSG